MKFILLGAPGAGKGTQAQLIMKKLDIPQISTGDMLREAIRNNTTIGRKCQAMMEGGQLIPDEIMIDLVKLRIEQADCVNGFLLDGFPRTIPQADAMLSCQIKIDHVLEINVADDILINRLSGRRVHLNSGRVYHTLFNPPKVVGIDDVTGEKLVTRIDDQPETVAKRLAVYHHQSEPLIEFYRTLAKQGDLIFSRVDGSKPVEQVNSTIATLYKL